MERFKLHIEAESRIRWKVYVRFGGEFSETDHSNMARRWLLSLRNRERNVPKEIRYFFIKFESLSSHSFIWINHIRSFQMEAGGIH